MERKGMKCGEGWRTRRASHAQIAHAHLTVASEPMLSAEAPSKSAPASGMPLCIAVRVPGVTKLVDFVIHQERPFVIHPGRQRGDCLSQPT